MDIKYQQLNHVVPVPRPLSYNGKPPLTHYCLKDFALSFLRLHTPLIWRTTSPVILSDPLRLERLMAPTTERQMDTRKYNELSWQQDFASTLAAYDSSTGTPPPSIPRYIMNYPTVLGERDFWELMYVLCMSWLLCKLSPEILVNNWIKTKLTCLVYVIVFLSYSSFWGHGHWDWLVVI